MQLNLSNHTVVDWDMFCREACCEALFRDMQMIGGAGKVNRSMNPKLENANITNPISWRASGSLVA